MLYIYIPSAPMLKSAAMSMPTLPLVFSTPRTSRSVSKNGQLLFFPLHCRLRISPSTYCLHSTVLRSTQTNPRDRSDARLLLLSYYCITGLILIRVPAFAFPQ